MIRHQLPVESPLPGRALLAGLGALLGAASDARASLERRIASQIGGDGCVLTDSGTTALTLALALATRVRPGPVALPAWSCFDVATAAVAVGREVLLYDLDPRTLGPDAASLDAALGAGARIVVVAHLYGLPVPMATLRARVRDADGLLIEDAAQAIGAMTDLGPAGAGGDLAVLSFGRGKGLTGGGGGALLVNHAGLLPALRELDVPLDPGSAGARDWLAAAAQWAVGRPSLYGVPRALPFLHLGETRYRPPEPGRRISRAAARIVERAWPAATAAVATRRSNAHRLSDAAVAAGHEVPVPAPLPARPSWLRLPVVLREGPSPGALSDGARRLGVERGYPLVLEALPALAPLIADGREPRSGAALLAARLVTLPTHGRLGAADLRGLESWLARA